MRPAFFIFRGEAAENRKNPPIYKPLRFFGKYAIIFLTVGIGGRHGAELYAE